MKRFMKTWPIICIIMLLPVVALATDSNKLPVPQVLTLDECLKRGLENNNQILLANSNIEMYQKQVQQAFGYYLPTVSYEIDDYTPYSSDDYKTVPYIKSLTISQTLYNGGRTTFNYKSAKLNLENALSDKRKTQQDLAYQIKAAFYDLWLKQQNLLTAVASQDNMGKHYQLVNRMYIVGSANKLELYQAQGQWEEQKVATMTAKNEVAQSRLALAILSGIDKFQEFSAGYDLARFNPADVDGAIPTLVEKAYQARPEMEKVRLNVYIAENSIKTEQCKFYPSLGLTYNYEEESDRLNDSGYKLWYLMLSVSGTVFDGFSTQSSVAAAKQNLISAQYQLKLQQDQIFSDVAQALQSLKQSRELIQSTRLNVEFMKERVHLTELQYNNGKANTTDFIDAQTSLDKALNSYYNQVMNYLTAVAKLDYAMGKVPGN